MKTKRLVSLLIIPLVMLFYMLIAWQSDNATLAARIAQSATFSRLNTIMDIMQQELHNVRKANASIVAQYKISDYQNVLNNSKLSSQEKDTKLAKMGMKFTDTYANAASEIGPLNQKLNIEFPELAKLPLNVRKEVLNRAFGIALRHNAAMKRIR